MYEIVYEMGTIKTTKGTTTMAIYHETKHIHRGAHPDWMPSKARGFRKTTAGLAFLFAALGIWIAPIADMGELASVLRLAASAGLTMLGVKALLSRG